VLSAGGNWDRVFIAGAVITIVAAIAAKFVLAPMRKQFIEAANEKDAKLDELNLHKSERVELPHGRRNATP